MESTWCSTMQLMRSVNLRERGTAKVAPLRSVCIMVCKPAKVSERMAEQPNGIMLAWKHPRLIQEASPRVEGTLRGSGGAGGQDDNARFTRFRGRVGPPSSGEKVVQGHRTREMRKRPVGDENSAAQILDYSFNLFGGRFRADQA